MAHSPAAKSYQEAWLFMSDLTSYPLEIRFTFSSTLYEPNLLGGAGVVAFMFQNRIFVKEYKHGIAKTMKGRAQAEYKITVFTYV